MLVLSKKIENQLIFKYKFTFCTLVTKYAEYEEMINSAKNAGFDGIDVEYLYFDNKNSNVYDGYSGINRAIREAQGEYLIFCHQDIIFHDDQRYQLEQCLTELEVLDSTWAIAGNAGRDEHGYCAVRISDPNGANVREGQFPYSVSSLDENFLVINRKNNIGCSVGLSGFHLYGTDLCLNAIDLGYKAYAIDFHLLHKSVGTLDKSFFDSREQFIEFYRLRRQTKVIYTMCTIFLISKYKILLRLFDKTEKFRKKIIKFKKYL